MAEKQPLLTEDRPQGLTSDPISDAQRLSNKTWPWIAVIAGALGGISMGMIITGSYLIELATSSCPKWSESATVYAEALLIGTIGLGAPIHSFLLRAYGANFLACLGVFLLGFAWGSTGLAAHLCSYGSTTEILYVVSYGFFLGMGLQGVFLATLTLLISWFPNRIGFCSTFPMIFLSLGSIAFGQWFLEMERLYNRGSLKFETILLMTGLVIVLFNVLPVFVKQGTPTRQEEAEGEKWKTRDVMKDPRFWLIFWAKTVLLLPGWGIIGRQKQFLAEMWRKSNPPLHVLSAVALGSYTVSRLFWTFASDRVRQIDLWMVSGALQTLTISLLPIFIYHTASWGVYAAITAYCVNLMTFTVPKSLGPALLAELYGSEMAAFLTGLQAPSFGIAGLVGPVFTELLFRRTGDYSLFLFISGGLAISGLVTLSLAYFIGKRRLANTASERS